MIILKEVPIECITVGERFREEMGDISMLAESFRQEGVIQPLAVRDNEDGTYTLLAGGRRHAAAVKANLTSLPVRCYPLTLSELEMRSIELMENVCRKDLTWIERSKLRMEIHTLQVAIHGEKISTRVGAEGWSKRDTARLLGESPASVVEDMKLAQALEAFPVLQKARTRDEAVKMLGKLHEEVVRSELASRITERIASTPIERVHQNLCNQYLVGDFFTGVKGVPAGSIDLVELDPPYAIALDKTKRDGNTENYNEVAAEEYVAFMALTLQEAYRVMSNSSWLILWHALDWRQTMLDIATGVGFDIWPINAIWYKGNVGQTNSPNIHLASCYEPFFYLRKGNPSITRQGRSNVFHFRPVPPQRKIHPTERPIEMIQEIFQTFCWEGARILSPFLGSGNTLLAASNLGMQAFGWDLSQEYKNAYIIRVAEGRPGSYRSFKEDICQDS